MAATQARALCAELVVHDADPDGDAEALDRLALWALKLYAPIVAADPPAGLVIDASGAAHLFGGEDALLADMVARLASRRFRRPRRHGRHLGRGPCPGAVRQSASDDRAVRSERPGHRPPADLGPAPAGRHGRRPGQDGHRHRRRDRGQAARAPGAAVRPRADPPPRPGLWPRGRAHRAGRGAGADPGPARCSPSRSARRRPWRATPCSWSKALCEALEAKGLGARTLDLRFHRVDNRIEVVRVGMAKPVRDIKRLTRLLCDKLETVDPGLWRRDHGAGGAHGRAVDLEARRHRPDRGADRPMSPTSWTPWSTGWARGAFTAPRQHRATSLSGRSAEDRTDRPRPPARPGPPIGRARPDFCRIPSGSRPWRSCPTSRPPPSPGAACGGG